MAHRGVAGVLGNYRWFGAPGVSPLTACDHGVCECLRKLCFSMSLGVYPLPWAALVCSYAWGPISLAVGSGFWTTGSWSVKGQVRDKDLGIHGPYCLHLWSLVHSDSGRWWGEGTEEAPRFWKDGMMQMRRLEP